MPSHRNPERLLPALLLAVVVLLVVIAGSLLGGLTRAPAPLTRASTGSEVLPDILRSLQRIEDEQARVAAELEGATTVRVATSTASDATTPDPPGVRGTQPVRRELEDLPRVDGRTGLDWASVIDKRLARCLVEYAKTPYDEGVSPLLRQATQDLETIEIEYSESHALLVKEYNQHIHRENLEAAERTATRSIFQTERRALRDARDAGEERVRVGFREALAALDS